MDAKDVIERFNLAPLPEEGGFFRETFRDNKNSEGKSHSTCIYYLITPEEFSGLHAVKSSEIFHFYAGDPVEMVQIDTKGKLSKHILSSSLEEGTSPQIAVAPLVWQGTKLLRGGKWALLGCSVAPGFEYSDFINGTFKELSSLYPQHSETIREYTHG